MRIRNLRSTALAAFVVSVVTVGCTGAGTHHDASRAPTRAPRQPACTPPRPAAAGTTTQTFRFDGHDRAYLLALPPTYDGKHATPLVFDFHGFAGRKETQDANSALSAKGTERGDIVVTPDSLGVQWNAFSSPTEADDFGFVHALLADLQRRLCVDAARVYAAGHSNGSAFASFVVCKPPAVFAAVAMVSATTPTTCPAGVRPAAIAIAGTADPQVPYAGGLVGGSTIPIPAAPAVIKGYATRYGCEAAPASSEPFPGVQEIRYSRCAGGSEVVLDTVVGGTHSWPDGVAAQQDGRDSAAGKTFPATERILHFFATHTGTAPR